MSRKIQSTRRKPRIAIAGATGRVGSALTGLLASDAVDITILFGRRFVAPIGCSFRMARRHSKWPTRSR